MNKDNNRDTITIDQRGIEFGAYCPQYFLVKAEKIYPDTLKCFF